MSEELREMRDLLIELRVTVTHMNNALAEMKEEILRRERATDSRLQNLEERTTKVEQIVWYACGAVAILTPILTYLIMEATK